MRKWNIYVLNRRMRTVNSMDDLISRDFIKSLQPEPDCVLTVWGDCSYAETGCSDCDIKAKITKALELFGNPEQSAQPEREKGKWLPDNNNYYEERFICSVCGRSYKVDTCMGKPMWNFCPCGADMR